MDDKSAMSVERAVRRSLELFHGGFCCSESVLLALTERLGLQSELVPRIATGFCGGMAHAGSVCGAVFRLPFRPDGVRPVYCRRCFQARRRVPGGRSS